MNGIFEACSDASNARSKDDRKRGHDRKEEREHGRKEDDNGQGSGGGGSSAGRKVEVVSAGRK
eukprot:8038622-Lingulodinium_polyedra.AAC.1